MLAKMIGESTEMSDKTTLAIRSNTAAKIRLVRAELGVRYDRVFTLDETVRLMLAVYENASESEGIVQATVAQMLGECA